MGVQAGWSIVVHNTGSDGIFAVGIVNVAGNPGDITIIWNGVETVIPPGIYYRLESMSPEPYCMKINEVGGVKFAIAGSYTIKLWAMHEGSPGEWFYDDERILTVNVTEAAWPVQIPVPFSGRLAPGIGLEATDSTPVRDVDLAKLLGGRIDYALKYESGKLQGITLYIYWNDELIAKEAFLIGQVGKTITGTFDLGTARIRAMNTLKIKMSQGPLGYNVCTFDCPTTLGFSEEPDQPPSGKNWWDAFLEWLDKNKYLIALGVVGVSAFLMYRPSPPVIIYQPLGKKGE